MAETRRGLTAEERMLRRDRARLQRERMLREVAGPRWRRMVRIVPVLFRREGQLVARVLQADIETVVEALRSDAVFALDTPMRLAHGFGFLAVREIQVYLSHQPGAAPPSGEGRPDCAATLRRYDSDPPLARSVPAPGLPG
jgi:hypothetical protein